jgi:hypothetical protein
MSRKRISLIFGLILIAILVAPALPASAANGSRYYAQTNHWVRGAFLDFFDRYGGVSIFGYPITEEFLEDGMTVQYFEKARFEWRPWNPDPYKVELTLLGYTIHGPADPPVASGNCPWQWGCRYFSETGHIVKGAFLSFFNSYGSLTVFGYPITEQFVVENGITIQYFQRARMEIYPGDGRVYLGNLGTEWLTRNPKWPGTIQPPAPTPANVRYFPETGYNVQGAFLDYWNTRGQLDIFGYPISGEFTEGGRTVQYFQRARMEWHPQNPDPWKVQLGLLGETLHGPAEPAVPNWVTPWNPRARYFSMTGHIVTEGFLDFFDKHGGVDIFGYPITEAQMEGGFVVQWFQRAKMEWRPENPDPWKVQLALLGSIIYQGPPAAQSQWEPIMGFGKVWRDNPTVKNGLGLGVEEQHTTGATEQKMQGGVFFWREDTRTIYAMANNGTWRAYADTWQAGIHPEAWGYNPPAGLYEAIRGFGKLWREQLGGPTGVFGWGLEPERGFTGTVQAFEKGLMLENERKEIFVLFNTGNWVKYPDMY